MQVEHILSMLYLRFDLNRRVSNSDRSIEYLDRTEDPNDPMDYERFLIVRFHTPK